MIKKFSSESYTRFKPDTPSYFKIRFPDNNEWLTKMVSTGYNKLQ